MRQQQGQPQSEWIVITSKTKGKSGKIKQTTLTSNKTHQVHQMPSMPLTQQFKDHYANEFFSSDMVQCNTSLFKQALKQIIGVNQIEHTQEVQFCQIKLPIYLNCLGIGDFMSKLKPAFQYHFFHHIFKTIQKSVYVVNVFDPILTVEHYDKINLDLGFAGKSNELKTIKPCNLTHKQTLFFEKKSINIFYMPHCERFLYEKLCEQYQKIQENEKEETKVLVIGNSIKQYIERCVMIGQKIPTIFSKVKISDQKRLIDYKEAFNDTFIYILN